MIIFKLKVRTNIIKIDIGGHQNNLRTCARAGITSRFVVVTISDYLSILFLVVPNFGTFLFLSSLPLTIKGE